MANADDYRRRLIYKAAERMRNNIWQWHSGGRHHEKIDVIEYLVQCGLCNGKFSLLMRANEQVPFIPECPHCKTRNADIRTYQT